MKQQKTLQQAWQRSLQEAKNHHLAGKLEEAERSYLMVLQLDPKNPDANHNLGVLAMQTDRLTDALRLLKTALEARPEVSQYWLSYVAALMQAGHQKSAREMLAQGIRRGLAGPDVDRVAEMIGVRAEMAPSQEEIDQALDLFNHRQFDQLVPFAEALTQRFPEHAFGWQLLGAVLRAQGRNGDALSRLQRAVELLPDDPEAHVEVALALEGLGRLPEAEAALRRALAIQPQSATAQFNLGNVLLAQRRLQEAEDSLRQALQTIGDFAEGLNNLGICQQLRGETAEAEASFRRAVALRADHAESLRNLGGLLLAGGRADEAVEPLQRARALAPQDPDCQFLLANACKDLGRPDDAETGYREVIRLRPGHAGAHTNLGALLQDSGRLAEAEASCRRAVSLDPGSHEALNNLGFVLLHGGSPEEGRRMLDRALTLKPDFAQALANRGALMAAQGRFAEADEDLRRAIEIDPDYEDAYGARLFALNYDPDRNDQEILAAYRAYDEKFGQPWRSAWQAFQNLRTAARVLKIGYVSPDLNSHAVRHFLEPLLAHHDHGAFALVAYADLRREDEATSRYRGYFDHWVPSLAMSDDELAKRIRADGIDILVDLAGHTTGNRLGVFARKPAPVQVTWLGYGFTTGLSGIDYFLTDPATVPEGGETLFAERPWRLATPALVYRPGPDMGAAGALPVQANGHLTLGSLSRAIRINHRVIAAWSQLLQRLPDARLVIDSNDFRDPGLCADVRRRFEQHGIGPERLQIGYHTPPWDVLRGMDIGLDCFPHNSGTTLFESLYMGVPFVTLAGRPGLGRLGSSILEGLGHPEWIAGSEEEYVEKVVALASDLPKLAALRAGLRAEMQASPLMDEAGFARKVEGAYRDMWATWIRETP